MTELKILGAVIILGVGWIVEILALFVRFLALCLLEVHLFLEWCMAKLVDTVDKLK